MIAGGTAKRGFHATRHNITDADIVITDLLHHGFRKTDEAELGSIISAAIGKSIFAGQAADVENITTATRAQARYRFMAAIEEAIEVCFNDCAPIFRFHLFHAGKEADAGVIDQDIKTAKIFIEEFKQFAHLLKIAHITELSRYAIGS